MPGRRFRLPFLSPRREIAREVDDELRSHLEMQVEELVAGGMKPAEARRVARRRFGSLPRIRRRSHHIRATAQRITNWRELVDDLGQDLRFAARTLISSPLFATMAILTLAIGIGANTAIFSVANGILLRSVPGVRQVDRLVEIVQGRPGEYVSVSYPIFTHLRERSRTVEDMAAFDLATFAVGGAAEPEVVLGMQATGNYFEVLGVRPAAGRFFHPDGSMYPAVRDAAVISYGYWQRRFAGDPDVIGRTLLLNGHPTPIIGVAERGFGGHAVALRLDIFVPVGMPAPQLHTSRSLDGLRNGVLEAIGRLAPGASRATAEAELADLARARAVEVEGEGAEYPLHVDRYSGVPGPVRGGVAAFVGALAVVVALVLVIACANVASLLLARAGQRQREVAIRAALGASRGRIIRQLLTESMLLASIATALGVELATAGTALLSSASLPIPLPGVRIGLDLSPDLRMLPVSIVLAVITGLLFGLAPASRITRQALLPSLQGHAAQGRSRLGLGNLLVVAQVATTVVLLVAAGLFLRALFAGRQLDLGFDTRDVTVAAFDLELNGYDEARSLAFYDALLEQARALPGVEVAALAGKLPLAGASSTTMRLPGVEPPPGAFGWSLHNQSVSPGYLEALGLRLVRGRFIDDRDRAGAPGVVVVNQTFARRFDGTGEILGRDLLLSFGGRDATFEIVGVVADASYHGLVEETPLFGYFSYAQRSRSDLILHLRGGGESAAVVRAVRAIVGRLDPAVPILTAEPLARTVDLRLLPQRLGAWVTAAIGAFGLILGALGTYAIAAATMSRRRREIGIRIALGARPRDIVRRIALRGLAAPAIGLLIGLAGSALLARGVAAFLVDVSPLDGPTFASVAVILASVAAVANLVPAQRAARVDPMKTLRDD